MQFRQLGQTGVFVSRICLGAMTFGGKNIPPYDMIGGLSLQETERLVGAALDAGVNFIDTADIYSLGESETQLGEILKNRRRDVVLATKFYGRMGPSPNQVGQSRLHLMNSLEDSLRRLRTDHIDLYQIHGFDRCTPLEESLRALDDAVRQGKIRYIGCSNLAAWQVSKALGISRGQGWTNFVSLQAYYSLVGRDVEREIVPMLEDEQLGLLVWSPLAGGFLSGKTDRHGNSDAQSRSANSTFIPMDQERAFDIIDVLKEVAANHGVSAAQVALAWLLAKSAVTSVIIGARRIEQLEDNLAAEGLTLSTDELARLDAVSELPPSYPGWMQRYGDASRLPA
jgi:aryl-alcohol dehydrogenase-like predicted oxidoreductase